MNILGGGGGIKLNEPMTQILEPTTVSCYFRNYCQSLTKIGISCLNSYSLLKNFQVTTQMLYIWTKLIYMSYNKVFISKVLIGLGIIVMFFFTGLNFFPIPQALLGGVITSSIILIIFEINERWLFPKFYISHHTRSFFLYSIIISFLFAGLDCLLDRLFLSPFRLFKPPIEMGTGFHFIPSLVVVVLGNVIGLALLFAEELKKQAVKEKQLKEAKLGAEIKLLKAQINPHFMFNALNNIYSLAYTKSDNAADSVLKLSEMLRYVLDDCPLDHVKLSAEISYIENFISFQQMKSEHEQNIQFKHNSVSGDELISPMLLIPFIENSFKYSKIEDELGAWIEIDLEKTDRGINFLLKNSIPGNGKPGSGSGMGITNVHSRLDLLYPNRNQLTIDENNNSFSINLELDLR